jgi:hypothetical protein
MTGADLIILGFVITAAAIFAGCWRLPDQRARCAAGKHKFKQHSVQTIKVFDDPHCQTFHMDKAVTMRCRHCAAQYTRPEIRRRYSVRL